MGSDQILTSSLDLSWLNPTTRTEAEIKAMATNCPVKDWKPNVSFASELVELLHIAHGLGPAFVYGLVKDLWSLDRHMPSITANILLGDLVDSISTLIGGMPGTGKTRCMALFSILVAGWQTQGSFHQPTERTGTINDDQHRRKAS